MAYSSYGDYLGIRDTNWVNKEIIGSFFKNAKKNGDKDVLSYQSFVEDYARDSEGHLGKLILEDDD